MFFAYALSGRFFILQCHKPTAMPQAIAKRLSALKK